MTTKWKTAWRVPSYHKKLLGAGRHPPISPPRPVNALFVSYAKFTIQTCALGAFILCETKCVDCAKPGRPDRPLCIALGLSRGHQRSNLAYFNIFRQTGA